MTAGAVGYDFPLSSHGTAMGDILIGCNDSASVSLDPRYGNRRGMIAGGTGTGKSTMRCRPCASASNKCCG